MPGFKGISLTADPFNALVKAVKNGGVDEEIARLDNGSKGKPNLEVNSKGEAFVELASPKKRLTISLYKKKIMVGIREVREQCRFQIAHRPRPTTLCSQPLVSETVL